MWMLMMRQFGLLCRNQRGERYEIGSYGMVVIAIGDGVNMRGLGGAFREGGENRLTRMREGKVCFAERDKVGKVAKAWVAEDPRG